MDQQITTLDRVTTQAKDGSISGASNKNQITISDEVATELKDVQSCLSQVCTSMESEFRSAETKNDAIVNNAGGPSSAVKTAAVVGAGMFSLLSDFAASTSNNTNERGKSLSTKSILANAMKAAKQTSDTQQAERIFRASEIELLYLAGKTTASTVGLVIHGFMTSDLDDVAHLWEGWAASLDMILYRVCWPTGSAESWNKFLESKNAQQNFLAHLTSNPWHVAQDKTVQVGKVLARFLGTRQQPKCFENRKVVLIGHSLGAAIVYQALLQQKQEAQVVDDAICLAGAFLPNVEGIYNVLRKLKGRLINIYSRNDQVFNMAFRTANFTLADAAGNVPLLGTHINTDEYSRKKILDLDITSEVPVTETTQYGHSYSAEVLDSIREKIKDVQ